MADTRKRILAVASGGGHWEQMLLLRDAFVGHDISFATTMKGLGERAGIAGVRVIHDCNRNSPMSAVFCVLDLLRVMARVRPQVIVSTGALPGFLALAIGRRFGVKTIWVDSIANAEELSMAGQKAKAHADLWLSQWPFVAERSGAAMRGRCCDLRDGRHPIALPTLCRRAGCHRRAARSSHRRQTCGDTDARPHLDRHEHLDPVTFDRFVREASVIVGHAGIGSILSAGRAGKPIILYPRRASLGEHRNEHQLATVAALCDRPGIHIAHSDEELEALLTTPDLTPFQLEQSANRTALVDRLRAFIAA